MPVYRAFKRTWWKLNPKWPDGLEPYSGRKYYFKDRFSTDESARSFCQVWNSKNDPGIRSMKAEYEET